MIEKTFKVDMEGPEIMLTGMLECHASRKCTMRC